RWRRGQVHLYLDSGRGLPRMDGRQGVARRRRTDPRRLNAAQREATMSFHLAFPRRGKVPAGRSGAADGPAGDVEAGLPCSSSTSPIRRAARATFPLRGKVLAIALALIGTASYAQEDRNIAPGTRIRIDAATLPAPFQTPSVANPAERVRRPANAQ